MSLDSVRWRGEWIWSPRVEPTEAPSRFGGFASGGSDDTKVLFRREFTLHAAPKTARLRITSNSRHILFVNGHHVLRGPIRSRARQLFYDFCDISDYLKEGVNCFAILVRHYGTATAWWEPAPLTGPGGGGGLVFEAHIETADPHPDEPTPMKLVSDSAWRTTRTDAWSPAQPADEISAQIPELFDARTFDPSWAMPGFDDSAWSPAEPSTTRQFGRPFTARPPAEPFGIPQPNPLLLPQPHTRNPQTVRPLPGASTTTDSASTLREILQRHSTGPGTDVNIGPKQSTAVHEKTNGNTRENLRDTLGQHVSPGSSLVMDFGGIVSGVVGFHLAAQPGVRVVVSLLESLDPSSLDSANYIEYITRGDSDRYESLDFMGGRYALVAVVGDGEVDVEDVSVTEYARPRPEGPHFHCDDESLNQIHAVALRTVDLCSRDAYMDCPTREQRAWVGDSVIHQSVDLTNNTNWSLAIRNTQLLGATRADGLLPMVGAADFSDPGMITIPDACLHWSRTVHNLYRYTGDRHVVAELMPALESVLRWFLPFQRDDGLLHDVTGWVLIDWAPTEVDGAVASLNGLWARALIDFAELCECLGDLGRAEWARGTHSRVREGFERFWDPERRKYVDSIQDGARSRRLSEHAHAAAVVGKLVPESRLLRVAEILLARDYVVDPSMLIREYTPATFFRQTLELRYQPNWDVEHELVAAQPFFRYVVHDALAMLGRADTLPGMLHDWEPLLASGPSALREVWRGQSYAHGWSATPARDLVLHIAGISPAVPGFDVVKVAPNLGPLRTLEASAPTPHGLVHVEVEEGTLTIESPRPVVLQHPDGTVRELNAGRTSTPWALTPQHEDETRQ